jgi:hypothetical protein
MEPTPSRDDALVDDLARALASPDPGLVEEVVTGGRAAFSFLTMEQELAGLVYDSTLSAGAVGAARAPAAARTVVFESETVSVQMEITPEGIVGQVVPTTGVVVATETADGVRTAVTTDELGCFTLPDSGHGPMRLLITTEGATTATEWTHLEPGA